MRRSSLFLVVFVSSVVVRIPSSTLASKVRISHHSLSQRRVARGRALYGGYRQGKSRRVFATEKWFSVGFRSKGKRLLSVGARKTLYSLSPVIEHAAMRSMCSVLARRFLQERCVRDLRFYQGATANTQHSRTKVKFELNLSTISHLEL